MSPNAGGGRSPPVVIVNAGIPARDERPLLVEREREARGRSAGRRSRRARGAAPGCSAIRATAVATRLAFGERGRSPAISMLARRRRRRSRRGRSRRRCGRGTESRRGSAAAPSPPNEPASVERKTIVCGERTRGLLRLGLRVRACELDQRRGAARVVVRARPGADVVPVRHDDDRVGRLGPAPPPTMLRSRTRPSPGTSPTTMTRVSFEAVELQRAAGPRTSPPRRPLRASRRAVGILRREIAGERSAEWCRRSPEAPASRAAAAGGS